MRAVSPAWLQAVQAFVTLAFVASFGGQVVVAMMLMRLPLFLWRRFQLEMTVTALTLKLVTGGPRPSQAIGAAGEGSWAMWKKGNVRRSAEFDSVDVLQTRGSLIGCVASQWSVVLLSLADHRTQSFANHSLVKCLCWPFPN